MSKQKQKNEENFQAYLKFGRIASKFSGPPPMPPRVAKDTTTSARRAFSKFDSLGSPVKSCRHARVLQTVMYGKVALNFHITDVWGTALSLFAKEGGPTLAALCMAELMQEFDFLPQWVWQALSTRITKNVKALHRS